MAVGTTEENEVFLYLFFVIIVDGSGQCLTIFIILLLLLSANLILKLSPLSTGCYKLGSAVEGASPIVEFKIMKETINIDPFFLLNLLTIFSHYYHC